MNFQNKPDITISNPLGLGGHKTEVILYAHYLVGTVRGKSVNGLLIHSRLFTVVGIIDKNAAGKDTEKICKGVNHSVPIFNDVASALNKSNPKAIIFLIEPNISWIIDIKCAAQYGLKLINTSFLFLKDEVEIMAVINKCCAEYIDLRDVSHLQAYPNPDILKRKAKVVLVTGTDCGLGKRTAAYELTKQARREGINATMYATGQTGLMLGEKGTVVDSLIVEFANGIISQHICNLDNEGYDLIFVEGQSDIFHPANSAVSLALVHGANPDCLVIVHDNTRKKHKGFQEDSPLYSMHNLKRYIEVHEMLSLPCGPVYKTVGVATIGEDNIETLINTKGFNKMAIADVLTDKGPEILLKAILDYFETNDLYKPIIYD